MKRTLLLISLATITSCSTVPETKFVSSADGIKNINGERPESTTEIVQKYGYCFKETVSWTKTILNSTNFAWFKNTYIVSADCHGETK